MLEPLNRTEARNPEAPPIAHHEPTFSTSVSQLKLIRIHICIIQHET